MQTKLSLVAAALASLLMTGAAQAATTANLSMTAKVFPSGVCDVDLSQNVIDYGDISASSLGLAGTALPMQNITYIITCGVITRVGMRLDDNRLGTSAFPDPNKQKYGLGTDSKGNKVGSYQLSMNSTLIWNSIIPKNAYILKSTDNGSTWAYAASSLLSHDPSTIYALAAQSATPESALLLYGNIDIDTVIAPKSTLELSRAVNLNGSFTFSLDYL